MRGEFLVWAASFFTLAAAIVQVFTHVGQINASAIPRVLWMVEVETSGLASTLSASNSNASFDGLYATTANNSALGTAGGLKSYYRYGLLGRCGYVDGEHGVCDTPAFGQAFEPFAELLSDVPSQYQQAVSNGFPSSRFKSNYASKLSVAAFWTVFLGSCLALLAFAVGLIPHRVSYALATVLTVLAWIGLAIGSAIWTAIYIQLRSTGTGVVLRFGNGIILCWVSFGLVSLAVVPFLIAACTYTRYDEY